MTTGSDDAAFDLAHSPVHLGLGARVVRLEPFDGTMDWYGRYGALVDEVDGAEGRLVSLHTFTEPWSGWEMHPSGEELVVCVHGALTLVQEVDGTEVRTELTAGQATVNPPGVWHTADVASGGTATVLFITAGLGTEQRTR